MFQTLLLTKDSPCHKLFRGYYYYHQKDPHIYKQKIKIAEKKIDNVTARLRVFTLKGRYLNFGQLQFFYNLRKNRRPTSIGISHEFF